MNSTIQFGESRDFSPTEPSSAWEVDVPGDIETVIRGVKQDAETSEDWTPWSPHLSAAPENHSSTLKSKRTFSDILRGVKVREDVLQCAIARLGGGTQGLQLLMEYVNYWAQTSPDDDGVTVTISLEIAKLGMPPTPQRHLNPTFFTSSADDTGGGRYVDATASPRGSVDHGAAYTRALRKSHLERRRGQKRLHQRHHSAKNISGNHPQQLRPSANHRSSQFDAKFESSIQNAKGYDFLFQKVLRASDVSSLGRIILPKKDAERYLPCLVAREGIMLALEDYHCGKFWTARYRFWPNNKSRMYLMENIGDFVNFHCLQERDLLQCYRNDRGGYVIRGQKVPSGGKSSARGPISSRGAQARGTAPTSDMESATASTPAARQVGEGESTCGTHNADVTHASSDSSNCTLERVGDAGCDQDGVSCDPGDFSEQAGYRTSDGEVLRDDFPALNKPLVQDWDLDPAVAMLSFANLKQRYMEEQFVEDFSGVA